MGFWGKFGLLIFLGSPFFSSFPVHAESFQVYQDRIESLEQQVEVSCSPSGNQTDPIRTRIAERILANDGATNTLLREIRQKADRVGTTLENAEQLVLEHNQDVLQKKKDEAHAKLDSALKKLNSNSSQRAPASTSDQYREDVRVAYLNFQTADQTPEVKAMLHQEVVDLRKNKLDELKTLAQLGERIGGALKKASNCYCRSGADRCKDKETLQNETAYYNAFGNYSQAKDKTVSSTGANTAPAAPAAR